MGTHPRCQKYIGKFDAKADPHFYCKLGKIALNAITKGKFAKNLLALKESVYSKNDKTTQNGCVYNLF